MRADPTRTPVRDRNSRAAAPQHRAAATEPLTGPRYWLFKSEPETYSFDQLSKDKRTHWNDVRNYQARNFLREAKVGDLALIYHSGEAKAVVGVARVVREAYPDLDPDDPKTEWVQIDIAHEAPFSRAIPLSEIKATKAFEGLLLIKQSRLSCMPISREHFEHFVTLGGATLK